MKKINKSGIGSILLAFVPVLIAAAMLCQVLSLSPLLMVPITVALFVLLAFTKTGAHARNVVKNGIDMEIWKNFIVGNLFKNNEFLLRSVDDSELVNYLTVHIPQAGSKPNVVKNRVKGGPPTDTVLRTDSVLDYSIDEFTTDPTLITNAEQVQLSYNKMESVLKEMMLTIRETVAENTLYKWGATAASTANILRTTGIQNNDPSSTAVATAATVNGTAAGNRLVFGLYDLRRAKLLLDRQNIPSEGRVALLDADMYDQLMSDLIISKYRDASANMDLKAGSVGHILGFDLYMRSSTLTYTNDATPVKKAINAAGATDDNSAMLFWQEDEVRRALGDLIVYEKLNDPTYYGDVYSVLMRQGGSVSRSTQLGVGAIVQAAGN